MNRFKGFMLLLIAMFFVAIPLAADVDVTWEWYNNDPAVKFFRYQLDGELDGGWTVVPSDVTSYTVNNLDGSQSYGLYLQQSYDGIWWSESTVAYSEIIEDKVPAVASLSANTVYSAATEEAIAVEDSPVETPVVVEAAVETEIANEIIEAEPAPKMETAGASTSNPADAPMGIKRTEDKRTTRSTSFAAGLDIGAIKLNGDTGMLLGFAFDAKNLFKYPVDAKLSLGFLGYPDDGFDKLITDNLSDFYKTEIWAYGCYAELLVGYHMEFNKSTVSLAVGPRVVFGTAGEVIKKGKDQSIFSDKLYDYGVTAQAGVDYAITNKISLGIAGFCNYMLESEEATFGGKGTFKLNF